MRTCVCVHVCAHACTQTHRHTCMSVCTYIPLRRRCCAYAPVCTHVHPQPIHVRHIHLRHTHPRHLRGCAGMWLNGKAAAFGAVEYGFDSCHSNSGTVPRHVRSLFFVLRPYGMPVLPLFARSPSRTRIPVLSVLRDLSCFVTHNREPKDYTSFVPPCDWDAQAFVCHAHTLFSWVSCCKDNRLGTSARTRYTACRTTVPRCTCPSPTTPT